MFGPQGQIALADRAQGILQSVRQLTNIVEIDGAGGTLEAVGGPEHGVDPLKALHRIAVLLQRQRLLAQMAEMFVQLGLKDRHQLAPHGFGSRHQCLLTLGESWP